MQTWCVCVYIVNNYKYIWFDNNKVDIKKREQLFIKRQKLTKKIRGKLTSSYDTLLCIINNKFSQQYKYEYN